MIILNKQKKKYWVNLFIKPQQASEITPHAFKSRKSRKSVKIQFWLNENEENRENKLS